jgi:hypothetical protein
MSRNNKLVALSRRVGLVLRDRIVILMGWTKEARAVAEAATALLRKIVSGSFSTLPPRQWPFFRFYNFACIIIIVVGLHHLMFMALLCAISLYKNTRLV